MKLHSMYQALLYYIVTGTIVGHVGDGNFHALVLCDPNNDDELSRAKTLANTISTLVAVTAVRYVVTLTLINSDSFSYCSVLCYSYLCK